MVAITIIDRFCFLKNKWIKQVPCHARSDLPLPFLSSLSHNLTSVLCPRPWEMILEINAAGQKVHTITQGGNAVDETQAWTEDRLRKR
jgi:hypothetical protein